ncbi:MAG: glycosyltransferase [Chloroflexi bacterium]|nr:glycosyltransferase [Chloroflexota bacterium]
MRVLYFSRDYTSHDHRFLSAITGSGHQVYYLRLEHNRRALEKRPYPDGVQEVAWVGGQESFSENEMFACQFSLNKIIKDIRPDVIHAGPIQTAAYQAARTGFRRLVSMSWGSDLLVDAGRDTAMRRKTRYALQRSSVLIADCQAVQQKAAEFGFPPERVVIFPWGVDLEHFSPQEGSPLRSRLGWQQAFVLISVRSWEPIYGVDVLVRAFARAAQDAPELRLILAGGGSQEGLLRQALADYGVTERVHFCGQVSNRSLVDYYRASDLYLAASHSDGSSVSLMEAMACGLPALVSDIPGNREWVTAGRNGWLFRDGSEDELAQGILSALEDRLNLATMGKAARLLAEERADWTRNARQIDVAYQMAAAESFSRELG